MSGSLNDRRLALLVVAVLVKRLGGEATVTQSDIDEVAYNWLEENGCANGVTLKLVERSMAS